MTDLFTRLARAAQGAAPLVRPRARSRFEDTDDWRGVTRLELEQLPAADAGDVPRPHLPPAAGANEHAPRRGVAPRTPEPALPPAHGRATAPAPRAPDPAPTAEPPVHAPQPDRRDAVPPVATATGAQAAQPPPDRNEPARELHHHHQYHHGEVLRVQSRQATPVGPIAPAPAKPMPTTPASTASPVEPRRQHAASAPRPPAPQSLSRIQPTPAEVPPPVIITIGRIDVRAVRESPVPPTPGPAPLPRSGPDLERYLSGLEGDHR